MNDEKTLKALRVFRETVKEFVSKKANRKFIEKDVRTAFIRVILLFRATSEGYVFMDDVRPYEYVDVFGHHFIKMAADSGIELSLDNLQGRVVNFEPRLRKTRRKKLFPSQGFVPTGSMRRGAYGAAMRNRAPGGKDY